MPTKPKRLTLDLTEAICADIRRGCFAKVAAARHGVSEFTQYTWLKRGEREAAARADAGADTETDQEPSLYEQFWREVEAAKAEARYQAEIRVFETDPKYWLTHGYARVDWRRPPAGPATTAAAAPPPSPVVEATMDRIRRVTEAWRASEARDGDA